MQLDEYELSLFGKQNHRALPFPATPHSQTFCGLRDEPLTQSGEESLYPGYPSGAPSLQTSLANASRAFPEMQEFLYRRPTHNYS
jgi:hypothetical protein